MGMSPEIIFSLRKSKVRREVLGYLVNVHPNKVYISVISKSTEIGINEVYGALNGVKGRYKKENTLISLGLVDKEIKNGICLYCATPFGVEVWRSCKKILD